MSVSVAEDKVNFQGANEARILAGLLERKEAFMYAVITATYGSTPRRKGAYMLMDGAGVFYGSVGGGRVEAEVQAAMAEAWRAKAMRQAVFGSDEGDKSADARCGGRVDIDIIYVDEHNADKVDFALKANKRVYIFGGGHVALALESLLRTVDFDTIVIDDRAGYAVRERFPYAYDLVTVEDFNNVYEHVCVDADSYVVIMTHGHNGDYNVLRQALSRPHAYIGMLGSKSKVQAGREIMRKAGFSEEELDRVHAPIGLKIGARTPTEIAVSIVAQMIAARAAKSE